MDKMLDFLEEDIENVRRVMEFCRQNNIDVKFEVHPKAETCEESAEHSPVSMDQIVKTLIFIGDEPLAVLCPGSARVSIEKLEKMLETDVRMANPEEVKERSGYPVGGVSPFDLDIPIYMESSLLEEDVLRPAGGSRCVGVEIEPKELKQKVDAKTHSLKE